MAVMLDMEMPTSCGRCLLTGFSAEFGLYCSYVCNSNQAIARIRNYGKRADWCPLIEVKDNDNSDAKDCEGCEAMEQYESKGSSVTHVTNIYLT